MSEKEEIGKYMSKEINWLLSQKETGGGRAMLANLRRGAGKVPGEIPELWGTFLNGIPQELLGNDGNPSRAEWAIYLSLTMLALHQQGSGENVHSQDISLGRAAAMLMEEPSDDERKRILNRFGPVVTAKDMPELSYHLRNLIKLLKSKDIKLDYIKLAQDIYDFQFEQSCKRVKLRWGQDFYYTKDKDEQ